MFANLKSFAYEERQLFSLKEIHRHDLFRDLFSHCCDDQVIWVTGVMIESRPVRKINHEAGVERAVEMQNIGTYVKAHDIRYRRWQFAQSAAMIVACRRVGHSLIFPANDMYQHKFYFRTNRPDY